MPRKSTKEKKRKHAELYVEDYSMADSDLRAKVSWAQEEHLSTDHRRVHREEHRVLASAKTNGTGPQVDTEYAHDSYGPEWDEDYVRGTEMIEEAVRVKAKRSITGDEPLRSWIPYRDEYLMELLRHEGRGDFGSERCPTCPSIDKAKKTTIRCKDCFDTRLVCHECAVRLHETNPLHVIEQWNNLFFERTTLQDLGLVVQLGHSPGSVCPCPRPAPANFLVLHCNGIHGVSVLFCGSELSAGLARTQLLRHGWYPATHTEPQTCATFRLLEELHLLNLQSKLSIYDFYNTLSKQTDRCRLYGIKDRYKSLLRLLCEWRHLKLLKRAGRGHDPGGVNGTAPGKLAVVCPACPHPGINLPNEWEKAEKDKRFLYQAFIALDACFRFKRRMISNDEKDPGLGTGWAYFVEDPRYKAWLLQHTDQKEMSTCSGLAALDHVNTKFSNGYSATGIGAAVCARHEFILPTGVGDLQKGERYANMDWVFAHAARQFPGVRKIISYDIACQWSVNIAERLKRLPEHLQQNINVEDLDYVIPKLHLYGHKEFCQLIYSLNFKFGVGRTDAEGIERIWSFLNPAANSTREMGPGSQHDTLDDQFGFSNWEKTISLGTTFKRKQLNAVKEFRLQEEAYTAFSEGIRPENLKAWSAMVEKWEDEEEGPKVNPYERPSSGPSEMDIRLKLAEEEMNNAKRAVHVVSVSSFLALGFELEDQRARIAQETRENTSKTLTGAQATRILEKRLAYKHKLEQFRKIQLIHMPCVPELLETTPQSTENLEALLLFLPSDLPSSRQFDGCSPGLAAVEDRL